MTTQDVASGGYRAVFNFTMNAAGDVPLDNSITPEGKYKLLSYWYHKELGKINQTLQHITVVDPGFPRGGANS